MTIINHEAYKVETAAELISELEVTKQEVLEALTETQRQKFIQWFNDERHPHSELNHDYNTIESVNQFPVDDTDLCSDAGEMLDFLAMAGIYRGSLVTDILESLDEDYYHLYSDRTHTIIPADQ